MEIEFVSDDPVEGWVRWTTGEPSVIRFSSWLGLFQAIVALGASDRSPSSLGGKLGARRDADLPEHTP